MSNLLTYFYQGQKGLNKGASFGKGLSNLDKALNGVQKGRYYTIAAPSKVGKSTFVNNAFVISPFIEALKNNSLDNIEWIYLSWEMDRISQEFDFATHFINYEYGIETVVLEEEYVITEDGNRVWNIPFSSNYLRGRLQDNNGKIIKVNNEIKEMLFSVYEKYIIPLFGKYDEKGNLVQKGKMRMLVDRDNPTGVYNNLLKKAQTEGKFIETLLGVDEYGRDIKRKTGYIPNNPDKLTIIICDHCRKALIEKGYTLKQNIDKLSEYFVICRNLFNYTFVNIVHTGRNLVSTDNLKFAKDELFPTAEDIKDSGNMSEDSDYVITLFNPNDDRYHLKTHFGLPIRDSHNNVLYPNMRTIHLVESRHTECPLHFVTSMQGNLKKFVEFKQNKND